MISFLSLVIWALIFVVTVEYVLVIMRANNKGEGGTLALTALAIDCVKMPIARWFVLAAGLIGASLFYGDSVITPAISVLSAIEGIMATVTSLALIVMMKQLKWPALVTVPLFAVFLIIDLGFFTANLAKFYDGG